jgi:hypothetical protein
MEEFVVGFVQKLGFPIFVAWYLMVRIEKRIEHLIEQDRKKNVLLAILVRVLSDNSAVPQEFVDEVSGVKEMPELLQENKDK